MLSSALSLSLLATLPHLASACVGNEAYKSHLRRQIASDAPPLSSFVPSITLPLVTVQSHAAGAQPSSSALPVLPAYSFAPGVYPAQDLVPPTNSSEVQAWVAAIDWSKVPSYAPNVAGDLCSLNPQSAADLERQWWTCGQATASTDIVTCPEKGTWGTSFDDGPSINTPNLLDYLDAHSLKTTFFTIGSRILGQPDILRDTHMRGHEISAHTWSHPQLTTLTNEEIVAELGWTRKLIKDIIGVSPTTFRPPQGDLDSRVRAIALQMDLTPVMWSGVTGSPGDLFDTQDFRVNAAQISATDAVGNWTSFLDTNLNKMETGFISLEHDLAPVTVGLAINYYLPEALGRNNPSLKLVPIIECQGKNLADAYLETRSGGSGSTNSSSTTSASPSSAASSTAAAAQSSTAAAAGASGSSSATRAVSAAASSAASSASAAAASATGGAGPRIQGRGMMGAVAGLAAGVVGVMVL